MREFYSNKVIKDLFFDLDLKFKSKSKLTQRDLDYALSFIFETIAIPYPNTDIIKYFSQPGILGELILDIHNSNWLDQNDRLEIRKEFDSLHKLFPIHRKGEELRFRILGNLGTYPIHEIKCNKTWYSNFGHRPNIITINKIESEDQFSNDSWLYWISRRELKFATCVVLSTEYNNFFPYFNPFDTISINTIYTNKIPEQKLLEFLNQWLDIKNSFIKPDNGIFNRGPRPDIATYKYDKFDYSKNGFEKLFSSYSIRNHLLLRTSNCLIKALMNRKNLLFQEEAVINSFLALEGSLHLLQEKYGDTSTKLNRELLRSVFKNEIKFLPDGEGTFEFIQESYSTRISLVHPQPKWGAQWHPYVDHESLRDNFGLTKIILNWVIAEREGNIDY
ncbi:MAG: hypothetical protein V4620_02400 [Bacteroidota bacterium]